MFIRKLAKCFLSLLSQNVVSSNFASMLCSENGPQITYVRDFKAKVHYFRFWCQVCFKSALMLGIDFDLSNLYM